MTIGQLNKVEHKHLLRIIAIIITSFRVAAVIALSDGSIASLITLLQLLLSNVIKKSK